MSAPKNIQRDGYWLDLNQTELQWPTAQSIQTASYFANTANSGAVAVDVASTSIRLSLQNVLANEIELIGVLMTPPDGDTNPYRVKADLNICGQSGTYNNQVVCVGYGPASPTGADDIIVRPYLIHFDQSRFDEVIMVPHVDEGHAYYGRPIFFGVGHCCAQTLVNLITVASISVQNLAVKPPTMQNAVS